jgi:hypothetical protein
MVNPSALLVVVSKGSELGSLRPANSAAPVAAASVRNAALPKRKVWGRGAICSESAFAVI